jgi:hypothetical protein
MSDEMNGLAKITVEPSFSVSLPFDEETSDVAVVVRNPENKKILARIYPQRGPSTAGEPFAVRYANGTVIYKDSKLCSVPIVVGELHLTNYDKGIPALEKALELASEQGNYRTELPEDKARAVLNNARNILAYVGLNERV